MVPVTPVHMRVSPVSVTEVASTLVGVKSTTRAVVVTLKEEDGYVPDGAVATI